MMKNSLEEIFDRGKTFGISHKANDLRNALRKGFWIYGAGNLGKQLCGWAADSGLSDSLKGFIDRRKSGTVISGYQVISPAAAADISRLEGRINVALAVFSPGNDLKSISADIEPFGEVYTLFHLLEALEGAPKNHLYVGKTDLIYSSEAEIRKVHALLSDDKSREIFVRHLMCRITGDVSRVSEIEGGQYFPEGLNIPSDQGCFMDIGAYNGDTLAYTQERGIKFRKYLAFEPDPASFRDLKAMVAKTGADVDLFPCALGKDSGEIGIAEGNAGSKVDMSSSLTVKCMRCDDFISCHPTYIKMDVEGFENDVLDGASETIAKHHPDLAVCVYHRPQDIWELPLRIRRAGYGAIHLRLHSLNGLDLVLYASR